MLQAFLQLCLAALTFAAPIADETLTTMKADAWQYGTGGGIVGFIVLILDVIVWIELLKSSRPVSHKILWALLVFIFPILGIIIYWLFSDRQKWNSGGYEAIA
ncbi:hypothetical protein AC578_7202 [Pseudocercospora eumusae]|uniref:Cardiolipin synthase N-terminal domain-containing protein n=1 Tax=Pseudocercospora eumusae TaxID=321146 RepID=A0A139HX21_9PEZI|nr:hypothetical protein AC578_7202 [Pseudocercospora eumusae]